MRRRSLVSAWLFGIGVSTGCAPPSVQRAGPGDAGGSSAATVVTATELRRVGQGGSVFTALQYARPTFLAARGGVPLVSVDGSPATDVAILRSMSVTDVQEVRLVRGTSGAGRPAVRANGDVMSGGDVILVLTRQRP
jgi:hypothetical protein